MFKVKKDVEYALISLVEMSRLPDEKLISANTISERYSIPFKLLAKILQLLSADGLVQSFKGRSGGYKLTAKPEEIQLGRIIRAVRGEEPLADCLNENGYCRQSECGCNIKPVINIYRNKWIAFIEKTTLNEFVHAEIES